MGVIFLAGIYGVGKTTLSNRLGKDFSIPVFNASDIISKVNYEMYGANKFVVDKVKNQEILVDEIQKILSIDKKILLCGHFCIINKTHEIDMIPIITYKKMGIEQVILLKRDPKSIYSDLIARDNTLYSVDFLEQMQKIEEETSILVCKEFCFPLTILDLNNFEMSYKILSRILNT